MMAVPTNKAGGGEWDYQFRDRPVPYPVAAQGAAPKALLTESRLALLTESGQRILT